MLLTFVRKSCRIFNGTLAESLLVEVLSSLVPENGECVCVGLGLGVGGYGSLNQSQTGNLLLSGVARPEIKNYNLELSPLTTQYVERNHEHESEIGSFTVGIFGPFFIHFSFILFPFFLKIETENE